MNDTFKINDTIPRINYIANGDENTFLFPFMIFNTNEINIFINEKQVLDGFSVSFETTTVGGKVIFAENLPQNSKIAIVRNLDIRRVTDFQEGGSIRSRSLNHEFNYQMACTQQVADALNRALILPPYVDNIDFKKELPIPKAKKAIIWNEEANALVNSKMDIFSIENALQKNLDDVEKSQIDITAMHENIIKRNSQINEISEEVIQTADYYIKTIETIEKTLTDKVNSQLNSKANQTEVEGLKNTKISIIPDYSKGIQLTPNVTYNAATNFYVRTFGGNYNNAHVYINYKGVSIDYSRGDSAYGYNWDCMVPKGATYSVAHPGPTYAYPIF